MYLVAALGIGLAGGSFIIGVAYVSPLVSDAGHQGTALGIFGAGNVGAAVTKFVAPFVMVAYGWHGVANVWAAGACADGRRSSSSLPRTTRNWSRAAASGAKAPELCPAIRAAEEPAGLAVFAVLLLRLRRLRGAGALAAALPDRRLRRRGAHGGHGGGVLQPVGQPVPRLWRAPVRQVRCAVGHVLDLRLFPAVPVHAVLSADGLRHSGQGRPDRLFDRAWGCGRSSPRCLRWASS